MQTVFSIVFQTGITPQKGSCQSVDRIQPHMAYPSVQVSLVSSAGFHIGKPPWLEKFCPDISKRAVLAGLSAVSWPDAVSMLGVRPQIVEENIVIALAVRPCGTHFSCDAHFSCRCPRHAMEYPVKLHFIALRSFHRIPAYPDAVKCGFSPHIGRNRRSRA